MAVEASLLDRDMTSGVSAFACLSLSRRGPMCSDRTLPDVVRSCRRRGTQGRSSETSDAGNALEHWPWFCQCTPATFERLRSFRGRHVVVLDRYGASLSRGAVIPGGFCSLEK